MKLTAPISRILASLVALGALCTLSSAWAADAGSVTVVGLKGKASYSTDGKTFKPLRVRANLPEGSVVRTEGDSQVDMKVFQGDQTSIVRANSKSQLAFDKLQYQSTGTDTLVDTMFDLSEGDIQGNVEKIARASKYQVKTPNGVAGIRGTQYHISANGTVTVASGRVTLTVSRIITTATGTQTVTAVFTIEAGQSFTPPPLTAEGTATLVAMANAMTAVDAARKAVQDATATGNAQAIAQAQAQLQAAQQSYQQAQATAINQAPPTMTTTIIRNNNEILQVAADFPTPTGGGSTGAQIIVVTPEPYVSPTTGG